MVAAVNRLKQLASDKTLLIVEDDLLVQERLEKLLSHFFAVVHSVSTGDEAIGFFASTRTDGNAMLIITDIHLENESGIDLTCRIKKIDPSQRVIAISGAEERSIFIESIRCGVDRFILKPIDQAELFDGLGSVLAKIDYDTELQKNRKLLEESREYALRLLEDQDLFLKNAIHEIHTPLSVIITNIDLLRLQGVENESLDAIEAGSRIIQNSYEDMTYLMKRDRIPDHKGQIDLIEFIKERKHYFTCIAHVNELSLTLRTGSPALPSMFFSSLKLSRLVDNTLSNAIKYSYRPGEVNIIVGMHKEHLFFEINNRGPLIVDKEKIFKRFYRESEHKGGYGLGLSIVAQICEEEGIEIQIVSTAQRGTTFRYIFKDTLLVHPDDPKPATSARTRTTR